MRAKETAITSRVVQVETAEHRIDLFMVTSCMRPEHVSDIAVTMGWSHARWLSSRGETVYKLDQQLRRFAIGGVQPTAKATRGWN